MDESTVDEGRADARPDPGQRTAKFEAGSNLEQLNDGVAAVAMGLVTHLGQAPAEVDDPEGAAMARWDDFERRVRSVESTPLGQLIRRFRLSSFELKTLVLALAAQIEPKVKRLVLDAQSDALTRGLTVHLVVDLFGRSAAERYLSRLSFLSTGPLIRHRLITLSTADLDNPDDLLAARLELSTPTLRYLLGEPVLSQSLSRYARLDRPKVDIVHVVLPEEHVRQARALIVHFDRYRELVGEWRLDQIVPYGRGMVALFSGAPGTGKTLLAQALAATSSRPLLTVNAADLPEQERVEPILRDLFAEGTMLGAIVLIDECDALLAKGDRRRAAVFDAMGEFEGILVLVTNKPEALDEALERRIVLRLPFELPDPPLRRQIWEVHLPPGIPIDGEVDLDGLATRYDYAGGTIKNAVLMAINKAIARDPVAPRITQDDLEAGCRSQLRYALEALTERTRTHLRLVDIVLPEEVKRKVTEILAACRNQALVLNAWGFGQRLATGKGITILFDGPPGTGKTFLSEILAGELDRPLNRINIPEIVSKWVGETEKHIKEVFQQARISHSMLLFDEADALFAKRVADPKSSNDRYTNMEVNLLLQEIERFPGVCILTTNHFGALDEALIRRIQYRVTFDRPNAKERAKIWETLCPAQAPLADDVDWAKVGEEFDLSGGQIKNAILRAAYRSADMGSAINLDRLRDACNDEHVAEGKVVRQKLASAPPPVVPMGPGRGAAAAR